MRLIEKKKVEGKLGIIHFIGIGGIGMSGLAMIMHDLGYQVQGSDLSSAHTKLLTQRGIKIFEGHDAAHVENVNYVVFSSAIPKDNPELVEAINKGIVVIPRAEVLAEIMRFKTCITVSGSHGKTSTTSMTAHMFEAAGVKPTVINGGIISKKATNAYTGSSDYLIAEADESDATFIKIPTTIGVITNIDAEHLDFYGSFEILLDAFKTFINNIPFYGFVVACIDQQIVRDLVKNVTNRQIITYSIENPEANIYAFNIQLGDFFSTFDVKISNQLKGTGNITIEKIHLPIPGIHNVLNSLAAIAIAVEMDFGPKVIQGALKSFQGVKRRFTKLADHKDNIVINDYAHHPEEILATLKAARNLADIKKAKLIAICQPHRYSRVINLFDRFIECFRGADYVYISEIYTAGEQNTTGISHHDLAKGIKHKNSKPLDSFDDLPDIISKIEGPKIILFMGAGSISHHAESFANKLKQV